MRYVTCDLIGPGAPGGIPNLGFGNQLFQVATVLALAMRHEAQATFPDFLKKQRFGTYFTEGLFDYQFDTTHFKPEFEYHAPTFSYHPIPWRNNMRIKGYFQSEKFFQDFAHEIRDILQPSKALREVLGNTFDFENTVAIHYRRGDYLNLQDHHPVCGNDYYERALGYIDSRAQIDRLIIFSDDIEWAKGNRYPWKTHFVEDAPDYVDMFLMSMCTHNIIANSSFSWWGAWLNKNPDKIVCSPHQWFGPKKKIRSDDIHCESWTVL